MVSLSLYGMKALWNWDKPRFKIRYQSFTVIMSTKSKCIFTSCMDRKIWIFTWQSNDSSIFRSRSSHPEVFCKKGGYRNFAKFTGKHLCQSRDSDTDVFLWILQNFEEYLFLRNTSTGCFSGSSTAPIVMKLENKFWSLNVRILDFKDNLLYFFLRRLKVWETELFVIRFPTDHSVFLSINFFITKYYII